MDKKPIAMPTGCEFVDINELVPFKRNPKKHDIKDINLIVKSIERNGWGDPLLVCPETKEILSGNGRYLAAKKIGLDKIPIVYAPEGLTEKQKADMVIANNRLVEASGYNDNLEILMEMFELDPADFAVNLDDAKDVEEKEDFQFDATIPQYEVKGEDVDVKDCFESGLTENLIKEIEDSELEDDEKKLLIIGAYRKAILNYRKIAEYYAGKASEKMQDLMERMGLVIIDYDNAIANGFTVLTEELSDMIDE